MNFDRWIPAIILWVVGGKMVYEGIRPNKEEQEREEKKINPLKIWKMIGLGFALNFDALAVGVSFGILNSNALEQCLTLLCVNFIMSSLGIYFGGKFNKISYDKIEIVGGIIIILIGFNILFGGLLN